MPWGIGDVEKHHKGLSSSSKSKWSSIANKVLADTGDEGRAIRIANSSVRKEAAGRKLKRLRGR